MLETGTGRAGDLVQRARYGVRARQGADSHHRRHRPRYVAPNISITGELSGLTSGHLFGDDYRAHYFDFDLYGTVNFNDYVGAQVGYRSFNVFYHVDEDEGDLDLRGLYFGGVVRF